MRARTLPVLLFLATCILLAAPAKGQTERAALPRLDAEAGRSFITNFAPADYDAEGQNWSIVQDARGVLYAGNNSGLLEYDGVAWRPLQLPNRSVVRSLARDAEGRIWVGGRGDLGYLAPDSLGRTAFVSLREQVPEAYRDFADVWQNHATD